MNSSSSPAGPGGATLFWLSAVILGGLLFAAGVMVGRSTAPAGPAQPADALAHIDTRDQGPAAVDEQLTFPDALAKPVAAAAPRPKPAGAAKPAGHAAAAKPEPAPAPAPAPGDASGDAHADASSGSAAAPAGPSYCLQVASFRLREQAEELAKHLVSSGLPDVWTVSGEVAGKGMYYRVRLGRFADREAAERFQRKNDLKGLIIQAE